MLDWCIDVLCMQQLIFILYNWKTMRFRNGLYCDKIFTLKTHFEFEHIHSIHKHCTNYISYLCVVVQSVNYFLNVSESIFVLFLSFSRSCFRTLCMHSFLHHYFQFSIIFVIISSLCLFRYSWQHQVPVHISIWVLYAQCKLYAYPLSDQNTDA